MSWLRDKNTTERIKIFIIFMVSAYFVTLTFGFCMGRYLFPTGVCTADECKLEESRAIEGCEAAGFTAMKDARRDRRRLIYCHKEKIQWQKRALQMRTLCRPETN